LEIGGPEPVGIGKALDRPGLAPEQMLEVGALARAVGCLQHMADAALRHEEREAVLLGGGWSGRQRDRQKREKLCKGRTSIPHAGLLPKATCPASLPMPNRNAGEDAGGVR